MANLRREGFRETLPTLKASDLRGAKCQIVTVASADIVPGDKRRGGRDKLLLLKFVEWPDRNYFPNKTSVGRLMKKLGDETDLMRGQQLPLVVVSVPNPETHEEVDALHVAPIEEWDDLFSEFANENAKKTPARRSRNRK